MNSAVPDSFAREWRTALTCLRSPFAEEFDWKQKLRESGLPGDVQGLIYRVVDETRLMRFEKKRIADELIAHFQDGQERGATFASLVSEFGDPEVAAQLIRNSKKRNRTMFENWYRPLLWFSGAGLLGFLGLTLYFYLGKPNPSIDYIPTLNADTENLADADRAWLVYREPWTKFGFCEGTRFDEIHVEEADGSSRLVEPTDGERWTAATRRLGESAELLESFRVGGVKPAFGLELKARIGDYSAEDRAALFPNLTGQGVSGQADADSVFDGSLLGVLLPHIQSLRTATRLLTVDSRWACEQGDLERAVRNIEAIFGMARQASEHSLLIGSLVRYAILGNGCDLVDATLAKHADQFSPQHLERIQSAISRVQIDSRDLFAGERIMFQDVVQRVFTDDGNGDGRITSSGVDALNGYLGNVPVESSDDSQFVATLGKFAHQLSLPVTLLTHAGRRETVLKSDEIFDQLEELLDAPFHDKRYEEIAEKAGELSDYPMIQLLIPACSAIRRSMFKAIGNQRGTIAALAVLRYRQENGKLPESIESLAGKYLREVPLDPLSAEPLCFRPSTSSFSREGFVIYSPGIDGDDDGGTPAMAKADLPLNAGEYALDLPSQTDGDWLLWPRAFEND